MIINLSWNSNHLTKRRFISSCTVLHESSNAFEHLFSMTQKYQLFLIYEFTTQDVVFIVATKRANAQNSLLFYALVWKVHVSFCHWSKPVRVIGRYGWISGYSGNNKWSYLNSIFTRSIATTTITIYSLGITKYEFDYKNQRKNRK